MKTLFADEERAVLSSRLDFEEVAPVSNLVFEEIAPEVCIIVPGQANKAKRRGVAWVAGSFLLCPCHLPFTLSLGASLLGGTALGTAVQQYPIVASVIITLVWGAGTWRGLRYFRAARDCTTCQPRQSEI